MKKRILIFVVVASMLATLLVFPTFAGGAGLDKEELDEYIIDWADWSFYEGLYPIYETVISVGDYISVPGGFNDSFGEYWFFFAKITSGNYFAEDDTTEGSLIVRLKNENTLEFYCSEWAQCLLTLEDGCVSAITLVDSNDGIVGPVTYNVDSVTIYSKEGELQRVFVDMGARVERRTDVSHKLVPTMFDGFGVAIGGIAEGLKSAFNGILYANGVGGAFSPLVIFIFVMSGLALALGVGYKIFGIIRARKG